MAGSPPTFWAIATAKCSTIPAPSRPRRSRSYRCWSTFFSPNSIPSFTAIYVTRSALTITRHAVITKRVGITSISSIDSRLIRHVACLHADIKQDHSCNQPAHVPTEQIKYHKRSERHNQRHQHVPSSPIPISHPTDERRTNRPGSAHQPEEASHSASVVIRWCFQEEHQRRPEGAERTKKDGAQRSCLSQYRLLADKDKLERIKLGHESCNSGLLSGSPLRIKTASTSMSPDANQ